MLHPEAQHSEHRTKTLAPTAAPLPQEPAIPNFGNQNASKALSPGTTGFLLPTDTSAVRVEKQLVKKP